MYNRIKELADEAIALQNKDRMDAVLREISGLCQDAAAEQARVYGAMINSADSSMDAMRQVALKRQLADAEALASAPSGFTGRAIEGVAKFTPSEFKPVESIAPAKAKKGGAK